MKYIRFLSDGKETYGQLVDNSVFILEGTLETGFHPTGKEISFSGLALLPPVAPSKVVCVGLNYLDHIKEFNHEVPDSPVLFIKPSTSVIAPDATIIRPIQSKRVDYEGELAIVVGKRASNISEKDAGNYIWGYTCGNDVTARDLQPQDGQWTIAKGFDTFAPIGPWVVTGIDPEHLAIKTYLNGQVKQNSNTEYLLFKPHMLLSFVSSIMTLLPGDVIMTGTSSGVGPMENGDEVIVEIEKIGQLRNVVSTENASYE